MAAVISPQLSAAHEDDLSGCAARAACAPSRRSGPQVLRLRRRFGSSPTASPTVALPHSLGIAPTFRLPRKWEGATGGACNGEGRGCPRPSVKHRSWFGLRTGARRDRAARAGHVVGLTTGRLVDAVAGAGNTTDRDRLQGRDLDAGVVVRRQVGDRERVVVAVTAAVRVLIGAAVGVVRLDRRNRRANV